MDNHMDDHLRWYLQATGRANPDRIGRALRPRTCGTCGRATFTGLDADVAGLPCHVDPAPLNPLGELQAALHRVTTYRVLGHPAGLTINRRRPADITTHPAGTVPVLPAHHCHITYPPTVLTPPPVTAPDTDQPPY